MLRGVQHSAYLPRAIEPGSLIYIETMAGKTITTLVDTTGIIGGHVLNVHIDSNWHITSVKLEDQ